MGAPRARSPRRRPASPWLTGRRALSSESTPKIEDLPPPEAEAELAVEPAEQARGGALAVAEGGPHARPIEQPPSQPRRTRNGLQPDCQTPAGMPGGYGRRG